jgi:signal transduction histidine kinase
MAERIQTAGGQLELSSQPYQGTQVVLRLPG